MIDYVFITQIPPRHEGKPAMKGNKEKVYFNKIKENYASKELSLMNFFVIKIHLKFIGNREATS